MFNLFIYIYIYVCVYIYIYMGLYITFCVIVTHVNEYRFASDFGHLSAILQNLSASEDQG